MTISNRVANKIMAKAKRYIELYPNVSKDEMIEILKKNNEKSMMINWVMMMMGKNSD